MICFGFFILPLLLEMYEMLKCGREVKTAEIYIQGEIGIKVKRFFFVLLSLDWYRAISRHRIILVSTRFSTFVSLVGVVSKHRINLDSPRFSAFSTSQPRPVWCRASAQSGVTSLLFYRSSSFSRVEMFPSLFIFPITILMVTPPTNAFR